MEISLSTFIFHSHSVQWSGRHHRTSLISKVGLELTIGLDIWLMVREGGNVVHPLKPPPSNVTPHVHLSHHSLT